MIDVSKVPFLVSVEVEDDEVSLAMARMKYGFIAVDLKTRQRVLAFLGFDEPPTYQDRLEFDESIRKKIEEDYTIIDAPKHVVENIREKMNWRDDDDD